VWEEKAHRARREIVALAGSGIGVGPFYRAAIALVDAAVPGDLACWALIDPESLRLTAMVNGPVAIPAEYEPRLAEAESRPDEPYSFADLAARRITVSRSADRDAAARDRGLRFASVWRPLGIDEEARVQFLDGPACWGAAGIVRTGSGFSDREAEFLAAVAPALAAATRLAVRAERSTTGNGDGTAVLVLDRGGAVVSRTPGVDAWRARFDGSTPGRFEALLALIAGGARSSSSGAFRSRFRDAEGRWLVASAMPLLGGEEEQLAVTLRGASAGDLVGIRMLAAGLTERERAVCDLVLAGRSTGQIARALFISENTVQDHLKRVFVKTGVRSRRELASDLRPAA
jgi:DNA-binding CsgD family transcriptional regulator